MSLNIIGDIAGNYHSLRALLEKMPEGEYISVGDMIDRGRFSADVVEFTKQNGRAVYANHEDLMVDWYFQLYKYEHDVWFWNGGTKTAISYLKRAGRHDLLNEHGSFASGIDWEDIRDAIDKSHIDWIKDLPRYIEHEDEFGKILITHAPINPVLGLEKAAKLADEVHGGDPNSIIWNRGRTKPIPGVTLQIFGHNSSNSVKWYGDPPHSVCIDAGRAGVLTGIHWPTQDIYQQEIVDEDKEMVKF